MKDNKESKVEIRKPKVNKKKLQEALRKNLLRRKSTEPNKDQ